MTVDERIRVRSAAQQHCTVNRKPAYVVRIRENDEWYYTDSLRAINRGKIIHQYRPYWGRAIGVHKCQ